MKAASKGHSQVTETLVGHGADVNAKNKVILIIHCYGATYKFLILYVSVVCK